MATWHTGSRRPRGRVEYTADMTYLLRQIGGERNLADEEIARLHAIFGPEKADLAANR